MANTSGAFTKGKASLYYLLPQPIKRTSLQDGFDPARTFISVCRVSFVLAVTIFIAACASYGPYHPNTSADPTNSIRGPADGRYKLAFIEFGDQGSALDTSQRKAALEVIHDAKRPLLFVYIHGWQNDANSADVCKFEHFIDTVSSFPEITGRKLNVIGVYIAWRGLDVTVPVAKFLTFWSRKSAQEVHRMVRSSKLKEITRFSHVSGS